MNPTWILNHATNRIQMKKRSLSQLSCPPKQPQIERLPRSKSRNRDMIHRSQQMLWKHRKRNRQRTRPRVKRRPTLANQLEKPPPPPNLGLRTLQYRKHLFLVRRLKGKRRPKRPFYPRQRLSRRKRTPWPMKIRWWGMWTIVKYSSLYIQFH